MGCGVGSGRFLRGLLALLLAVTAALLLAIPHLHAAGQEGDACPACAVGRSTGIPVLSLAAALAAPPPAVSTASPSSSSDPRAGRDPAAAATPRAPPALLSA